MCIRDSCIPMQKTNKQKLEELIRVDHAGESGAIKIYEGQLLALNTIIKDDEKKLREKIKKFRQDEIDHKDIAYEEGATKKGLYSVMDKVIKTGSRIAINISEKI